MEIAEVSKEPKIVQNIIHKKIDREIKKFVNDLKIYRTPTEVVDRVTTNTQKIVELCLNNVIYKETKTKFSVFLDNFMEVNSDVSDLWDDPICQQTTIYIAIAQKKPKGILLYDLENPLDVRRIAGIHDYKKSKFFPKNRNYIILYQTPQSRLIKGKLHQKNIKFKTITRLIDQRKWGSGLTQSLMELDPPIDFQNYVKMLKIMNLLLYMFGNLSNIFKFVNLV